MPFDDIKCEKCGHVEEVYRKNANDDTPFPDKCSKCGADKVNLKKIFANLNFDFDVGAGKCGNSSTRYGDEITYKPSTKFGCYRTKNSKR